MPNGHPDRSESAELDRFFAPLASTLESFAERHNLKLERYYHDSPSWHFIFKHPEGGVGKMEMFRQGDDKVRPSLMWWFDDYDTLQRHSKVRVQTGLPMDPATIVTSLEAGLNLILSWRMGQWDKTYDGYHVWRKTWTRDEFIKLPEQYPLPR
jgi:hypothetical protein